MGMFWAPHKNGYANFHLRFPCKHVTADPTALKKEIEYVCVYYRKKVNTYGEEF